MRTGQGEQVKGISRRELLWGVGNGIGGLALCEMLARDQLLAPSDRRFPPSARNNLTFRPRLARSSRVFNERRYQPD
jgi:hypothetical protein